jgi:uncharacterized protein (TIGR00251 family)
MADGRATASWAGADLVLSIHAQPGAGKSEVSGLHGGALKIRLQARAVEGAANAALIEFLADAFSVPKRSVTLLSGETSREKRVRIAAPERAHAERVLSGWGAI